VDEVRRELIAIQRRLVKRARAQLSVAALRERAEMGRYREALRRATGRFDRVSSRGELLEAAAASRVIFVADFHTLRQAQRLPLRLLEQLAAGSGGPAGGPSPAIALGVEMVLSRHQRALDRYLRGELAEPEFLDAVHWERTWGFSWTSYGPLLDHARRASLPVLALNSRAAGPLRLERRDRHAGELLARFVQRHPQTRVVVLFGELHVAEGLPRRFQLACRARGVEAPYTVVFQNVASVYDRLARDGLEQFAEVLRFGGGRDPWLRGRFCVLNATPLARIQSQLYWEENRLSEDRDGWSVDLSGYLGDQVVELVGTLCEFLDLPLPDLNRLTVMAGAALSHPRFWLARQGRTILRREIDTRVLQPGPPAPAEPDVVALSAGSIDHAAEKAAHFVHVRTSGSSPATARAPRERLYYQAVRQALGYFGSKVFNHLRTTWLEPDWVVLAGPGKDARTRSVARWVVRQLDEERTVLDGGAPPQPSAAEQMPEERIALVGRALGYMLGERLYSAVIQEFVAKEEVRELFRAPLARPGYAETLYTGLRRRLRHVRDFYRSREERL